MYIGANSVGFNHPQKQDQKFIGLLDSKKRMEIDDSQSRLKNEIETLVSMASHKTLFMKDVLEHPALYRAYPVLAKIPVEFIFDTKEHAGYDRRQGRISVSTHALESKKLHSNLIHELQHVIQHIEGFDQGASPNLIDLRETIKRRNEGGFDIHHRFDESTSREIWDWAYQQYQNTSGEIEARDVQARLHMSSDDRKVTKPFSSEPGAKEKAVKPIDLDGIEENFVRTKLLSMQKVSMVSSSFGQFLGIESSGSKVDLKKNTITNGL